MQSFILNIIPAPRNYRVSKGKRTSVHIRSTKEHIVDLIIKRGEYQDINDNKADVVYNTMKAERRVALGNLAHDLLICKQTQDPFFDIATNVSWTSIHESDRRVAIEAFMAAVWNHISIDLQLCEEYWAAEHMLAKGWNNRSDNQFKEVHEQLQIEEAVAIGVAATTTVTPPIQTEMQEASLQIIQKQVVRYIYIYIICFIFIVHRCDHRY